MNSAIQNVLNGLRNGNMSIAYEYKEYLNDVAMTLYNKPQLSAEDIDDLKGIITICSINGCINRFRTTYFQRKTYCSQFFPFGQL